MKSNSPIVGYGLIATAIAWAVTAVIIGIKYQQKSFLLTGFLAVLALLSILSGVLIIGRIKAKDVVFNGNSDKDEHKLASLIHLSALCGYLLPLANILLPFVLWIKLRHRSEFLYKTGIQAINFQLTCAAYFLSALMLCALFIGFIILPVVFLYQLIFILFAAYRNHQGQLYKYPGNLNFISPISSDNA